MKHTLLLITTILTIQLIAQSSINLNDGQFAPNKTYLIKNHSLVKMNMQFESEKMEDDRISKPIIFDINLQSTVKLSTGLPNKKNALPVTIEFLKWDRQIHSDFFGKTVNKEQLEENGARITEDLEGVKVHGKINAKGELIIKSIEGKVSSETRAYLKESKDKYTTDFNFPNRSLEVGEQLEFTIPLDSKKQNEKIPLSALKCTLTFRAIKDHFAYFDIKANNNLKVSNQETDAEISLRCEGELVYNLDDQIVSSYQLNIPISMSEKKDDTSITFSAEEMSDLSITIIE